MQRETMENACCASGDASNSCSVSMDGQQTCNCASQANHAKSAVLLEKPFSIEETRRVMQRNVAPLNVAQKLTANNDRGSLRQNIRGGVMLGIACITSPCCTPLIVPLVLGLLAGTPVALWLTQNVGWLYGGLTLLSVVSLVVGLRGLWQKLSLPSHSENLLPEIIAEARVYSTPLPIHEKTAQPVPASAEE